MAPHKPRAFSVQPVERRVVLRAGLENLIQQRELRERLRESRLNPTYRGGGALHTERSKAGMIMKVIFLKVFYRECLMIDQSVTHSPVL